MESGFKRFFSVSIIFFLLVSLVCPSCQIGLSQDTPESILSGRTLLYFERLCSMPEHSLSGEGVTRHMLQSLRRQNPKVMPLGFQAETDESVRFFKVVNEVFVVIVFVTVFMTIISYMFLKDGKKRIFAKN